MPDFIVYGRAPARLVKSVSAANVPAAQCKAKQSIEGWFVSDDDGIELPDIKIVTVEGPLS